MSRTMILKDVIQLDIGDIVELELDPSLGHEQQKRRPCVVVSTKEINKVFRGMIMIVPLTSAPHPNPKEDYPKLTDNDTNCNVSGTFLIDQVRTVDLIARKPKKLGKVINSQAIMDVQITLAHILGLTEYLNVEEEL